MYKINDLVLYSTHGICKIINITEKNYSDSPKKYYELTPLKDSRLSINIPVDSTKIKFVDLVSETEAKEIIASFKNAKEYTFDKNAKQLEQFNVIVNAGDRSEMVNYIYTLSLRKSRLEVDHKKLPMQEVKMLAFLEGVLYNELAISLKSNVEAVSALIDKNMHISV